MIYKFWRRKGANCSPRNFSFSEQIPPREEGFVKLRTEPGNLVVTFAKFQAPSSDRQNWWEYVASMGKLRGAGLLGCWVAFTPAFPTLLRSRFSPAPGQLSSIRFRSHFHCTTNRVRCKNLYFICLFLSYFAGVGFHSSWIIRYMSREQQLNKQTPNKMPLVKRVGNWYFGFCAAMENEHRLHAPSTAFCANRIQ